jgi:hypothetical protein
MTNPFVWFHNGSEKPAEAAKFSTATSSGGRFT